MYKERELLIVGNSEIAEIAFEYFDADSIYRPVGFAIDPEYIKSDKLCGLPVVPLGEVTRSFPQARCEAFVAIGNSQLNRIRRRYFDRCKQMGYTLATYISSRASVWRNAEIGQNCLILEDNVLNPFVRVGDNVTLWSGNHIGHRTIIEDDVFVASHVVISGFCRIGRSTFLGVNVAISDNVEVGEDNFIGVGANITRTTGPNLVFTVPPAEAHKVPATKFCRVRTS